MQKIDDALADTHGTFGGVFAGAAGHSFGIKQEYRVDIGRIIQLASAMFAKADDGKADGSRARNAFFNRGCNGGFQRGVGKVGEYPSDAR